MVKTLGLSNFSRVNMLRFFLAIFALLEVAAHLFASPGTTPQITFWLEVEIAVYSIIAIIYLLGLRFYYTPALLFSIFNILIYFISAFVVLPGISTVPLVGHIQFLQYSFGRGVALSNWILLIVFGAAALKYDKGSEINAFLRSVKV
jgi:hypothetical protein